MENQPGFSKVTLGFLLAFISAVCYGSMGTFMGLLGGYGLDQISIATLSPTFVAVYLAVKMAITNRQGFVVDWKGLLMMLIMGVVILNLTNIGMANAVMTVPVAIVSIMMFCNVFIVMVLSRILFKYKITAVKIITAVCAIFGLTFVLDVYHAGVSTIGATGLMWTVLVMIVTALAYTGNKYILEKGYHWEANLFYQNLFAAIFMYFTLSPWNLAGNVGAATNAGGTAVLFAVLGFGLIPNIISFVFYMKGMELIEPTFVGLMYTLDPVTAAILGFAIFGQVLSGLQIMGILIVLAAIVYIQLKERQEEKKQDQAAALTN
ncbi:MAG: DMT family transporter [Dehalobacterium sp.]